MEIDIVLKDYFDLSDFKLTKLEGYDSINFKVQSTKGTFVLKRYPNSAETIALLQSEGLLLKKLCDLKAYDFPTHIASKNKGCLVVKGDFVYRLLSFVDGDFLGDMAHTPDLLNSLGTFLGEMDKTLAVISDTAIVAKETRWDLRHFKKNRAHISYIPDPKNRSLVAYFFMQFNEHVSPIEYQLRRSIIHNDANDWNVLTKNGRVSGIIDFGDMCHSWLINELAIAITYVMMGKENPLEIAIPVIQSYHKSLPLQEKELDILYYLVAARLCTSVCNSAYSKTLKPQSDYITISERPAWELLYKWLRINPIRAKDQFRKAAGFAPVHRPNLESTIKRRKQYLSDALSLSYEKPIEMYRSAFQYMYDSFGNTFLDAYNNIMIVGHCHPKVVGAGQRAMAKLNTNTRYLYDEILDYSKKLLSHFPAELNKVFFVNSGSAASDLAIRLAMAHTKKNKIMALEHGYHGNTKIGTDISHYKYDHQRGSGKQDYILQTPTPKVFGSGFANAKEAGEHFAKLTASQIAENENDVAAFIAEPIVGCGGQVPLAKGYLRDVYPRIRKQGGVCISDEVQVGFGRLGTYFWGFEMHQVTPDMVILGKPMGNGHPIGAVVTTTEIAESFDKGPEFFSSFGGNPVSCAIAHAVLEVIEEEGLQQNAGTVGEYLITQFKNLQKEYPEIVDVRGCGLFLGIELADKSGKPNTWLASEIKNRLRRDFVLIGTDGPYESVLKIKPPLTFTIDNSEILICKIQSILKELG